MSEPMGQIADSAAHEALAARLTAIELELGRLRRELEATAKAGALPKRVADIGGALARIGEDAAAVKTILAKPALTLVQTSEPRPAEIKPTPLCLLRLHSDQLTLIRGIDAKAAGLLNELGIHAFADIAALTPEDVAEIGGKLGSARRISKDGWIEQAALLAQGIETAHARRIRSGDFAAVVAAPAGATVVNLAERRAARLAAVTRKIGGRARTAGIAIAASLILMAALNSTGFGRHALASLGVKPACAGTLSQLWTGCSLAQLP